MSSATDIGVALTIGEVEYHGWEEVSVTRSLESMAGGFEIRVSDRWSGETRLARPIGPGRACALDLAGRRVVTGWIDELTVSYDGESHTATIRGRDLTADLVDCSAVHEPGEWHGLKLDAIAEALAKPFGIEVVVKADLGAPFRRFRVQEGETAFEAIERACRHRAVLPTSDAGGRLVLARPAAAAPIASLFAGRNILAVEGNFSDRERYSLYRVKGQAAGDDDLWGEPAAAPKGEAKDPAVARYRPLIVLAEDQADTNTVQDRADWEAAVRAGRARRAEVTVQGWTAAADELWWPGRTVSLDEPFLGLDRAVRLLIAAVEFTLAEDSGRRTRLSLVHPKAFQLRALPEPAEEEEIGW